MTSEILPPSEIHHRAYGSVTQITPHRSGVCQWQLCMDCGFPSSPAVLQSGTRTNWACSAYSCVRKPSAGSENYARSPDLHHHTDCRKEFHSDRDSAGGDCSGEVRAEEVTATSTCTNKPDCPCAFCGSVRLLLDQEAQRARTDINQLAEQFIREYLERQG